MSCSENYSLQIELIFLKFEVEHIFPIYAYMFVHSVNLLVLILEHLIKLGVETKLYNFDR